MKWFTSSLCQCYPFDLAMVTTVLKDLVSHTHTHTHTHIYTHTHLHSLNPLWRCSHSPLLSPFEMQWSSGAPQSFRLTCRRIKMMLFHQWIMVSQPILYCYPFSRKKFLLSGNDVCYVQRPFRNTYCLLEEQRPCVLCLSILTRSVFVLT